MSKEELNSYRLTSMEEPTDEMLAQIMHEAAEQYKAENETVQQQLYAEIYAKTAAVRQKYGLYQQ